MSLRPGRSQNPQASTPAQGQTAGYGGYAGQSSGAYGNRTPSPYAAASPPAYSSNQRPPAPRPSSRVSSSPAPAAAPGYAGYRNAPSSGGSGYGYGGGGAVNSSSTPAFSPYGGSTAVGYGGNTGYGAGYGSSSALQQQSGDIKNMKKGRRGAGGSSNAPSFLSAPWFWSAVAAFIGFGLAIHYKLQLNSIFGVLSVDSVSAVETQISELLATDRNHKAGSMDSKDSLRIANEHKMALEKDNRAFAQKLMDKDHELEEYVHENEMLQSREEGWKKHVDALHKATQRQSRRAIMEK